MKKWEEEQRKKNHARKVNQAKSTLGKSVICDPISIRNSFEPFQHKKVREKASQLLILEAVWVRLALMVLRFSPSVRASQSVPWVAQHTLRGPSRVEARRLRRSLLGSKDLILARRSPHLS